MPRPLMHKRVSCKLITIKLDKHDIEITEKEQQYVTVSIREFEE